MDRHSHRHHHGHGHHEGRERHGPRGGERGFGRGAGRVFAPGDLRLMLLDLLEAKPSYGYELIKRIEEQFGGAYAPSPGSVYPTLTLLDETGLVRGQPDEQGKRRYEISADGRAYLASNRVTVDAVRTRMQLAARALAGDRPPEAIFQAMQTLKAALAFHRAGWSDAEVQRVSELIHKAAQAVQSSPTSAPAGEA